MNKLHKYFSLNIISICGHFLWCLFFYTLIPFGITLRNAVTICSIIYLLNILLCICFIFEFILYNVFNIKNIFLEKICPNKFYNIIFIFGLIFSVLFFILMTILYVVF